MKSANGTSISTSHLAYRWKVEMKRRGGIKEKREDEMRGLKKKGEANRDSKKTCNRTLE